MAAYWEGRSLTDRRHTAVVRGLLQDTHTKYQLLCDTDSIERVTIPSIHADRQTLVQALKRYILLLLLTLSSLFFHECPQLMSNSEWC